MAYAAVFQKGAHPAGAVQTLHVHCVQVRIAALEASLASEHELSGRLQQQVGGAGCVCAAAAAAVATLSRHGATPQALHPSARAPCPAWVCSTLLLEDVANTHCGSRGHRTVAVETTELWVETTELWQSRPQKCGS